MMDLTDELLSAVEIAEQEAQAAHLAGTCHLSEWSCGHCEAWANEVARRVRGPR